MYEIYFIIWFCKYWLPSLYSTFELLHTEMFKRDKCEKCFIYQINFVKMRHNIFQIRLCILDIRSPIIFFKKEHVSPAFTYFIGKYSYKFFNCVRLIEPLFLKKCNILKKIFLFYFCHVSSKNILCVFALWILNSLHHNLK